MSSKVLNTKEAAAYLRIGIRTIYRLAASGHVPAAKVGARWLFHVDALDTWLISLAESNLVKNNLNKPNAAHHTSSESLTQEVRRGKKDV